MRDRIEFLEGDLFAPLAELRLEGAVDVLASNPPYVNEETFELLQPEVRDWEPREALFGGVDGLDFYRRLIAESPHYLKPGGYVVLEIGFSQVDSISEIVKGNALELVDITPDLQGFLARSVFEELLRPRRNHSPSVLGTLPTSTLPLKKSQFL